MSITTKTLIRLTRKTLNTDCAENKIIDNIAQSVGSARNSA